MLQRILPSLDILITFVGVAWLHALDARLNGPGIDPNGRIG